MFEVLQIVSSALLIAINAQKKRALLKEQSIGFIPKIRKGIARMKRNLLALAVGVAFVLPLAAQAAPTVYGRLNLSVDYMDVDTGVVGVDGKNWELNSNASRVGVKGNEKLTDELTAVYKAEWEVQGDMAAGNDLGARERYIGLKHYQLGTIRLGHIDSPFKNSEDSVDVFNDMANLDMGNFIYGQNRLANSINYVSPKFLDVFGANLTLQPGEKSGSGGCGPSSTTFELDPFTGLAVPVTTVGNDCENHIADAISLALSYEDDSLYLSVAMDKEVANVDAMRFVARYKMNDITLSAMFQTAEPTMMMPKGSADKEQSIIVSGSYTMDKVSLRGEVLSVQQDYVGGGMDDETMLIGVGVDYNFTQSTKAFANLASGTMDNNVGALTISTDAMFLGFGMETRF